MATLALDPAYRRVDVDEFLAMDFGGARAELDDGIIFMVAGGSEAHARIASNILIFLGSKLRGSGCRPYGSDFATRTGERTLRFPDVSVYCTGRADPKNDGKQLLGDPQVIVEVLSPSTASHDQKTKLEEYRSLAGVREIVLADSVDERVRLVARSGEQGWSDHWLNAGAEVTLPSLGIVIPSSEIFARD